VLAARCLSGLEPADGTKSTDDSARGQVAADIYAALPRTEREAIASIIAETPGIVWLGHPDRPDEHAATRPCYAGALTATLGGRGRASVLTVPVHADREDFAEPVEAAFARRGRSSVPQLASHRTHEPDQDQHLLPVPHPPVPDMQALQRRN
jgi:hypothetical protein